VFDFLQSHPFLLLFGVVAAGMATGRLSVKRVGLGSVVGIILVGVTISATAELTAGSELKIPEFVQTIFFNVFCFAVGVRVGPQFFSGLGRDGWRLVLLGLMVPLLATPLAYLCIRAFALPQGTAAGLLAGANNASAAFGAAASAVHSDALRLAPGGSASQVLAHLSAAFALSYTVGELVFVLYMRLLPRLARFDARAAARAFAELIRLRHPAPLPGTPDAGAIDDTSVCVRMYRVGETRVAHHSLQEIHKAAPRVSIDRVRRGYDWIRLDRDTTLEPGDEVVLTARLTTHVRMPEVVGPELPDTAVRDALLLKTVDVVVQRPELVGHTVDEVKAGLGAGLYPNAIFRGGEALPLGPTTEVRRGDVLRLTGTEEHLARLADAVGPVVRGTYASDVLTLAIGLLIGELLGAIPIPLFGLTVRLGAAAILIAGILFGWIKTRQPALGGPISEGGRSLMETLGLYVFTAVLAIDAGPDLLRVVTSAAAWPLLASTILVTLAPATLAYVVGRYLLAMNGALLMGALAGARHCTPSLQAAEQVSGSSVPALGYPVPMALSTVTLSIAAYVLAVVR
jgi:putative transport protein